MQDLGMFARAPVNLDRNLVHLVMRTPFNALGYRESCNHRPLRIGGGIGSIGKGPFAPHKITAKRGQTSQEFLSHSRRLRVVIVEDEAIVAMELEMLLEDLDVDVVGIAMSAADACDLVLEHQPDVVTMDINIKGHRDGISAALEIFETYGVRSIFISSFSDPETQKRAEPCDPIAWITKPFDISDLADAVNLVKWRGD